MDTFDDDHDDIPELRPPEEMPPVRTQADLHRHWRALMGELGFGYARLYVQLVPPDGRVDALLMEIDDLPDIPEATDADAFLGCFKMLLDQGLPEGTRLALLYARPGRRGPSAADRAWAQALTAAAERAGVPIWQVHAANDHELRVMTPDDLVEPA